MSRLQLALDVDDLADSATFGAQAEAGCCDEPVSLEPEPAAAGCC